MNFYQSLKKKFQKLQKLLELDLKEVKTRIKSDELHEQNPMLGHRGCRLGYFFSRNL